MPCIYDLDNEYGGRIITDGSALNAIKIEHSGTGPAFESESYTPGQPAVAIYSTASARPLHAREITVGGGGALFQSAVTYANAVTFGKTVIGNQTTAPVVFANLSQASVPVIDFGNNFISAASTADAGAMGNTGTAEKWIVVRAGNINYGMPLFSLSTQISGPGAY